MAKLFLIAAPRVYHGGPGYWKHETGELPGAVWAYLNHVVEPKNYPAPTDEQLKLIVAYLEQWVNADVWAEIGGQLAELRAEVKGLTTVEQIRAFVWKCVAFGIDPL